MELQVVLQEGQFMEGYGKKIVMWCIGILLDDITKYEEGSQLLVNLKMTISNQPSVVEVTQLLNTSDIVAGTPNMLPLKGNLFLRGSKEEIRLLEYEASIYYVAKV